MMKKLIWIAMASAACFTFGCLGESDESTEETDESGEVEEVGEAEGELAPGPGNGDADKECFGCDNHKQTCCSKGNCWEESC